VQEGACRASEDVLQFADSLIVATPALADARGVLARLREPIKYVCIRALQANAPAVGAVLVVTVAMTERTEPLLEVVVAMAVFVEAHAFVTSLQHCIANFEMRKVDLVTTWTPSVVCDSVEANVVLVAAFVECVATIGFVGTRGQNPAMVSFT